MRMMKNDKNETIMVLRTQDVACYLPMKHLLSFQPLALVLIVYQTV